jgi:hypothetical protein
VDIGETVQVNRVAVVDKQKSGIIPVAICHLWQRIVWATGICLDDGAVFEMIGEGDKFAAIENAR